MSDTTNIERGSRARTLVLDVESEESWQLLLSRWCKIYKPVEDSLEYDFVLRTAQADWHRIRTQLNYDAFIATTEGRSSYNWSPDQLKQHDFALRYKSAAERSFQREYRLLEQYYKIHCPIARKEPENPLAPPLLIVAEDPSEPKGYRVLESCFGTPRPPGYTRPPRPDP